MIGDDRAQTIPTRRAFLATTAGMGATVMTGSFATLFGTGAWGTSGETSGTIMSLATTAEALALAFYQAVIHDATFQIEAVARGHLDAIMKAEATHFDAMRTLGGATQTEHFYLPERVLADASVFVQTGLTLEAALTQAYLAATHQFAAEGQALLAAMAARHAVGEAQHITVLSHLAGLAPHDALRMPAHDADALPVLAPFILGGAGFTRSVRLHQKLGAGSIPPVQHVLEAGGSTAE